MRFFDAKEEVLDVQLTQVGKRKLSHGRFRPYYYAFFDDDILYDSSYASLTEEQNSAVPRIVDETPRLKTQYNSHGVEVDFSKIKAHKMLGRDVDNKVMDRSTPNVPLGSSFGNEFLPAWDVTFAGEDASIETFINSYSGSWGSAPIPQISSSLTVKTRVEFQEEFATSVLLENTEKDMGIIDGRPMFDPEGSTGLLSTETEPDVYPDGSYLVTVQPSLLLDVSELNSEFTSENFDVEVFEILTESVGSTAEVREILRPLKFTAPEDSYSRSELLREDIILENPDFVGHYVEAIVDGELSRQALDKILARKGKHDLTKAKTSAGKDSGDMPVGPSPYRSGGASGPELDSDDLKEPC